jgi:hypothetical protein
MDLLATFVRGIREGSPVLYWAILLHLAAIPFVLGGLALDSRVVLGINPWIKPLKFVISAVIFMATVAWLLKDAGHPRQSAAIGWIVAIAMIVENMLIAMQSIRGIPSHFNTASALNAGIFSIMGLFIVMNTVALAWLGVLYLAPGKDLSPGYLWGVRFGILIFLLGSAEAGLMLRIARHTVGAADGGPGLPFVNWSTRFGDLRIGHFVGLHALQALPFAGWWIDRFGVSNAPAAVTVAAIAYAALFMLLTLQALAGKPLAP